MESHTSWTFLVLFVSTFALGVASNSNEIQMFQSVPHLFVLGDSGLDAGTNNYIPNCKTTANFPPYGMTYFHHPTGRFSDGRTLADFLAKKLGLPFPQPYLDKKADFSKGINFASGGSGILDDTGSSLNVIPMSLQVTQFSEAIKTRSKREISNSIVLIQVGSNDFKEYLLNETMRNITSPAQFISLLLIKYNSHLTKLRNQGVTKFVISDISPLGCFPSTLITKNTTDDECLETVNKISQAFNDALFKMVSNLNKELKTVTRSSKQVVVVLMKTYPFFMDVLSNGQKYGFKETSNACCGGGAFNAVLDCDNKANVCKNPGEFIFWDRYHQTDRFHSLLNKVMWSGNSSYVFPYNVKDLACDGFLANA